MGPLALVVGVDSDAVAGSLTTGLRGRAWEVIQLPPDSLASTTLHVQGDAAFLAQRPLAAVAFCGFPTWSQNRGFAPEDDAFCGAEARAAWLGVLQLRTVSAINRWDAEVWYSSSEWSVWRRRFVRAGVPLSAVSVGKAHAAPEWTWLPWGGAGFQARPQAGACHALASATLPARGLHRSIWCDGTVLTGDMSPVLMRAGTVLRQYGVRYATLLLDEDERIVTATSSLIAPVEHTTTVAQRFLELYDADLHSR